MGLASTKKSTGEGVDQGMSSRYDGDNLRYDAMKLPLRVWVSQF
jgi:hypothetical protein